MISTRIALPIVLLSFVLPSVAGASDTLSTAPAASGLRVEVTPQGAFLRGQPSAVPASGSIAQTAGLIWTHADGGALWIGENVSIGNHGSQVFTEYTLNNEAAALLSAYDTNPPTPLWTDTGALGASDQHVASAEASGIHVALHALGGQSVLSKYTTLSGGVPDWTYTFTPPTNGGTNVGISRDGQTIVAAISDVANGNVDIAVFSPASGIPVSYTSVAVGSNAFMRGFDLSADGSTLYFSPSAGSSVTAHVFDITTQTVVFSTNIGASFDSHAISGDGSVFAFGNFNTLRVFEYNGTTYVNTITRTVPGQNYVAEIDISDDSSTVAYGFTFYNQYLTIRVEAIDVATQAVAMTDIDVGTGSAQNIVSGVSISADGSRFAVGLWGDAGGQAEEMRLYAKNQNAPLGTVNLPGSIFGIAISADGTKMAGASKAVHANQFGNGGRIDLYGDGTPFTNYCFGDGALAACPCASSGVIGHGCENSAATGGALLTADGSVSPDSVVLTASAELPNVLSAFVQGTLTTAPVFFGDGLRCLGGNLKRLYVRNADASGTTSAPGPADSLITTQSALLGDPITPGTSRYYQVHYRDPNLGFCSNPPGNSWNVTNAIEIMW